MKIFNKEKIIKYKRDKLPFNKLYFWVDIAINLIIIFGLVFLIRTYVISPFQVYGPSMCNTFNSKDNICQRGYGEYLIVNKFGYLDIFGLKIGDPKRGDIVVFHPPHNDKEFYIKRIIGMPNETVELIDGYVYIKNDENPQGIRLEEPYLSSENLGQTSPMNQTTTFKIPEDGYFVMGDNRKNSSDARSCFSESFVQKNCGEDGTSYYLTKENIEGKAFIILWPLNKISFISKTTYDL